MVYLAPLSVDRNTWRRIVGRLLNCELGIMRRETVVAYFNVLSQNSATGSASRPCRLIPGNDPPPVPIVWEAGRVTESIWALRRREKSCTVGNRNPGCPASSPSLYRPSYPDFFPLLSEKLKEERNVESSFFLNPSIQLKLVWTFYNDT
jgi:hypothetical protein